MFLFSYRDKAPVARRPCPFYGPFHVDLHSTVFCVPSPTPIPSIFPTCLVDRGASNGTRTQCRVALSLCVPVNACTNASNLRASRHLLQCLPCARALKYLIHLLNEQDSEYGTHCVGSPCVLILHDYLTTLHGSIRYNFIICHWGGKALFGGKKSATYIKYVRILSRCVKLNKGQEEVSEGQVNVQL